MIPIRYFSTFISRISLIVILVLSSLFIAFSLTKHLFKTDSHRFVPVENHLHKNHRHHRHPPPPPSQSYQNGESQKTLLRVRSSKKIK